MVNEQRTLLRAAVIIHDTLTRNRTSAWQGNLPLDTWHQYEALERRASKARRRGLLLAATRLERQCLEAARALSQEAAEVYRKLEQAQQEQVQVSVRDIYCDLVAVRGEFDELQIEQRTRTISVATEPIVLEGVDLGRFEIQLDWTDIGMRHAADYRVIAREPNPAVVDDSVTHPHVQDESLCEGDGRVALRCAVEQGRMFDFFVIVANLLRTYNPSSPYVSLSNWNGVECSDCGVSVPEDEQWSCEQCRATVCGDCTVNCTSCDEAHCDGCITACEGCEQNCCQDCLRRCTVCQALRCRNCLTQHDKCEDCDDETCEDEANGEAAEADREVSTRDAGATLQPDRLGETAVPA